MVKIEINKELPIGIRSAKLIENNGFILNELFMIKFDKNIKRINKTIKLNQSYFIMGNFKYDLYKNPISYTVFGSDRDCVKDIPWDFPCIEKVIGLFPFKN